MKKPPKKPKGQPKQKSGEKKKKKYKVRNWREYNEALVQRGSIFFWIDQSAQDDWHPNEKTGKRGKPKVFSDAAIEACLTVRNIFRLPLRATEGFVNSLFTLMRLRLSSPDYSTLSLRGEALPVSIHAENIVDTDETLHIVVDSSGAKVYGEGEWKVRQHGWSKRRTWRKFHLAVDEKSKRIKATEVTGNDTADGDMLKPLLRTIPNPIDQVSADGAYDKRKCYDALSDLGIIAAIPPQRNARIWWHNNRRDAPHARDENLRSIRNIGRAAWKKEIGYNRRSIAENAVFRFKTVFGDIISSRKFENQRTEILIKCKILNRMALGGMPETVLVA
jgi:hypothetical protein